MRNKIKHSSQARKKNLSPCLYIKGNHSKLTFFMPGEGNLDFCICNIQMAVQSKMDTSKSSIWPGRKSLLFQQTPLIIAYTKNIVLLRYYDILFVSIHLLVKEEIISGQRASTTTTNWPCPISTGLHKFHTQYQRVRHPCYFLCKLEFSIYFKLWYTQNYVHDYLISTGIQWLWKLGVKLYKRSAGTRNWCPNYMAFKKSHLSILPFVKHCQQLQGTKGHSTATLSTIIKYYSFVHAKIYVSTNNKRLSTNKQTKSFNESLPEDLKCLFHVRLALPQV